MRRRTAGFVLASATLVLAGCGAGSLLLSDKPEPPPATDFVMEGRWILAAPNAPTCGMTFTGPSAANEGRVNPDGGCPERFFLSRRWRLADGVLTIVDEDNAALATLHAAGDRFEGKSSTETAVTLSR